MAKMNLGRGYAVLELNQVAFPRDGRIEAQLPLDADCFGKEGWTKPAGGTFDKDTPAEVGMILKVDKANGKITLPTDADVLGDIYALNYSTEHMYDEREPQLNRFCMYPAQGGYSFRDNLYDDFYPRMGFLAIGDRFTTNCVAEDNVALGDLLYAGANGYWTKTKLNDIAPVVRVVELTTCPNDIDPAVKVVVVKE